MPLYGCVAISLKFLRVKLKLLGCEKFIFNSLWIAYLLLFLFFCFCFFLKSHSETLLSRGSSGEFLMSRVDCISVILWIHILINRKQGVLLLVPQFLCSEDVSYTLMQIHILTLGLDHVNPVES